MRLNYSPRDMLKPQFPELYLPLDLRQNLPLDRKFSYLEYTILRINIHPEIRLKFRDTVDTHRGLTHGPHKGVLSSHLVHLEETNS